MYSLRDVTDEEWTLFTSTNSLYPYTDLYKKIQEAMGRKVVRHVFEKDGTIIGYFQAVIYPLFKNKNLVYLPYGPMLVVEPDSVMLTKTLAAFGKQHNAVVVRIDPEGKEVKLAETPSLFYRSVYHQPRGEWVLDVRGDVDLLLSVMHKKTRYNVNKAEKQGMFTTMFHGKEILDFTEKFIELNKKNTESHNTTTHPDSYFKTLFELAAEDDKNFIAVTNKDDAVLAINIFIQTNDEVFCPFGASSQQGKTLGAYYHIKWHAILHMKELGVKYFNWGGISVGLHDGYLSGVTQFKQGFGGFARNHGVLYDIIVSQFWYFIYSIKKTILG